jgi:hypothetical protein
MPQRFATTLVALTVLAGSAFAQEAVKPTDKQAAGIAFFEKKIRPVLVAKCYKCHSKASGKAEGGLLLDTKVGIRKGGDSTHAVVPGNLKASLLWDSLNYTDLEMPPDKPLSAGVIADFRKWIEMGAPDPRDGGKPVKGPASNDLWSLKPIFNPKPPAVKNTAWSHDDIDRFVLAKLEAAGLKPVADADKQTLLRRISFDLVGLPPTPAEIKAFLADDSPKAYEAAVDRLLQSPGFGERWGRHWLDVVRFAESNGKDRDKLFPHAWRYRRYVIESYNADKPFDRFITEQLAGDLLPADNDSHRDQLRTATGMLAIGPKPLSARARLQMDLIDDQIDVTSRAVLGMTAACARCHDHKFDPIPTHDYYALAGIFRSTETLYGGGLSQKKGAGGIAPDLQPLGSAEEMKTARVHLTKLAGMNKQLVAARKKLTALQKGKGKKKAKGKKKQKQTKPEPQAKPDQPATEKPADEKPKPNPIAAMQQQIKKLQQQVAALNKQAPPPLQYAMAVREAKKFSDVKVHIRGEAKKLGEAAPRGFLSAVKLDKTIAVDRKTSGRLELAQWLTDSSNPLTARVAVNRIWHHLFGRGFVGTVDNFGTSGEKPTHPQLLDHLSQRFIDGGWSTKSLVRTIVLSRTYRLGGLHDAASHAKDPANELLWRSSRRRLDVEALRDAMLAASGKLDLAPPERSRVAEIGNGEVGRGINTKPLEREFLHRTVYMPILRTSLVEMLALFDFPEPSIVVGRRDVTTVPTQALYFMNSPLVIKHAEGVAQRAIATGNDNAARVQQAYQLVLARTPNQAETARVVAFVSQTADKLKATETDADKRELAAWTACCQALFASAEFRYVD